MKNYINQMADIIKQSMFVSGEESEIDIMEIATAAAETSKHTDLELLHTLVGTYMDMCGISITYRTIIFDCAQQIFERMCRENTEISLAQHLSLIEMMPYLHEEYDKDEYDEYDITCIDTKDYAELLLTVNDELRNRKTFVALASGFVLLCQSQDHIIENYRDYHNANQHTHQVEQIFKEWVVKQKNGDNTAVKQPTWQDICIIADTPLTREFAEYIYSKGFSEYDKDILTSCNFDYEDARSKEFLDAIVREGLDWKVYDSFSLSFLFIKLNDEHSIRVYAQSRMFATDSTPVVRFRMYGNQCTKYYPLILRLDSVSPEILTREETLSDELVTELIEWAKQNQASLLEYWLNEIDSYGLSQIIEK